MSPFLRKVATASGATAVQIVEKVDRQNRVIEHLGSAHTDGELAVLLEVGRKRLHAGQQELVLGLNDEPAPGQAVVEHSYSRLLVDVVRGAWDHLGFNVIDDEAFFQLVLARLVEPTSMSDSRRVITELGLSPVHLSTMKRALQRCGRDGYRDQVAQACFHHSLVTSGLSLLLYDVTTLYFEAEKEDDLRKVGYSKERRVDPQVVVGLLVDRSGFPLEIHCFAGNKAETQTIIPIVKAFQERNQVTDMVVVADAGMLSAGNLEALQEADLRFIVGSRMTKAPKDLSSYFQRNTTLDPTDGELVDTVTTRRGRTALKNPRILVEPVWDPEDPAYKNTWRTGWQYRRKRAVRDQKTLTHQKDRAQKIISGDKPVKSARFVKTKSGSRTFDETSWQRAVLLTGWKGYVTNIPKTIMDPEEIIASYHELWHVEQSFRMSKTDLRARPMFHHTREAIEAHLTIVFTALAISRYLYATTGYTLKRLINALKPLKDVTINLNGHEITATPKPGDDAKNILNALGH